MSENNPIIDQFLKGMPKVNEPIMPKKKQKSADQTDPASEFFKRTVMVRKTFYDRLSIEAVKQDKFIWQLLDEALSKYLNDSN